MVMKIDPVRGRLKEKLGVPDSLLSSSGQNLKHILLEDKLFFKILLEDKLCY
jgi:hypothetical protein